MLFSGIVFYRHQIWSHPERVQIKGA